MSTHLELGPPDVRIQEPGFLLAQAGPMVVFLRWGPIDAAGMDAIGSVAQALRASRRGPVGGLVVVDGEAPDVDAETRAAQRRMFQELLTGDRTRVVGVVEGESVVAQLRRSALRLFSRFAIGRGLTLHASVREAAAALGPHLGVAPSQIERLMDEVRALAPPRARA